MRICLLLTCILILASGSATAQGVRILSSQPNEEICLGETLPISVSVSNRDSVARTLVASFTIATISGTFVYGRSDTLWNILPGLKIDTSFPEYVTNPNTLVQLGSFVVCASVSALDSSDSTIFDWPFADSYCIRIFGIRTMSSPFFDPIDIYNKTASGDIPDQTKWASLGARVVDGEMETWDPPPPRDEGGPVGADSLHSPVVRLDRSDANGLQYSGTGIGDTLTSFPFNLAGQSKVVVTFDFMRSGKRSYPALWDAKTMIGPEHAIRNNSGQLLREGDSLIIEFKDPDASKCNPAKWNRIAAIGAGADFEFQNFWLRVNDSSSITIRVTAMEEMIIPINQRYFNNSFRFRLRLKASNNGDIQTKDDDDPWYIDNLTLHVPRLPEIEVTWVRVVTPYSKIPYVAAAALPVYLKIKNTSSDAVNPVPLKVVILDDQRDTMYTRIADIAIKGGRDSIIRMPDWNAQNAIGSSSKFTVLARQATSGFDQNTQDNSTYSTFYLNVEQGGSAVQEFAVDNAGIDPLPGIGNDIPSVIGVASQGIGFKNSSGSYAMKFVLPKSDTLFGSRLYFASASVAADAIGISVLQGDSVSCTPGVVLRAMTDTRKAPYDQFTSYYFSTPLILPAGIYWLSVSQLTTNTFMMGGNLSRGGATIGAADSLSPTIMPLYRSLYGTQSSPSQNNGAIDCLFAVETPAGSGSWLPWMPSSGYWPTTSMVKAAQVVTLDPTMSAPYNLAGTYLPMIRPMVGNLVSGPSQVLQHLQNTFSFGQSHPNPFTAEAGSVELNFSLEEDGVTSLSIYDAFGRKICSLLNTKLEEGEHTLRWDGKDANGIPVSTGAYVCRLTSGDHSASIRILVLR